MKFALAAALLAAWVYAAIGGVALCAGVALANVKQFPRVHLVERGFVDVPPARGFQRLCFWRDD